MRAWCGDFKKNEDKYENAICYKKYDFEEEACYSRGLRRPFYLHFYGVFLVLHSCPRMHLPGGGTTRPRASEKARNPIFCDVFLCLHKCQKVLRNRLSRPEGAICWRLPGPRGHPKNVKNGTPGGNFICIFTMVLSILVKSSKTAQKTL